MVSYLITGTSKGLGLAFTTELLKNASNFVIATARNPHESKGLQELASKYPGDRLKLLPLDVSSKESITNAAKEAATLLPNGLDHLVSNAGVNHQALASFEDLDVGLFADELLFNTVNIVHLVRAFLPLVRKSNDKTINIVSSQLGSIQIGAMLPGLADAYSVSKAALNMLGRKWSAELKSEGITVFMLHPGWVETDIGDGLDPWMTKYSPQTKKLTTEASAVDCVKIFESVKIEGTGSLFNHDGTTIPF